MTQARAAEWLPERLPEQGELVGVRSRRWLVEKVSDVGPGSPVVSLACADDDAQGEQLDVLWDYEIDRRILDDEGWDDLAARGFDDPRYFAAFLNTLRWNSSPRPTRTCSRRRSGPGSRSTPTRWSRCARRCCCRGSNLFIADDTGLGKTIEAGLIARELLLRKKAKTIVVACPPSVLEQWQAELEERFGLRFEILDRDYFARVRRERGFGVNPWTTHSRFLVSHNLLDRPDLRRPDARLAGPTAGREPADPRRGPPRRPVERRPVRDRLEVHPRRPRPRRPVRAPPVPLGHAAQRPLEQLLDAARDPRPAPLLPGRPGPRQEGARGRDGPPAQGGHPRDPGRLPEADRRAESTIDGLPADAPELRALAPARRVPARARETRFASTSNRTQAAAGLLVVGLQQRLLSSIEAFARSLAVHRRTVERQWQQAAAPRRSGRRRGRPPGRRSSVTAPGADDERSDWTEEELEAEEAAQIEAVTRGAESAAPRDEAAPRSGASEQALLDRDGGDRRGQPASARRASAAPARLDPREPCARACRSSARRADGPPPAWNERRVLIFTENREDTKRYLAVDPRAGDRRDRPGRRADRGHHRADAAAPRARRSSGASTPTRRGPAAHPDRHRRRPRGPELPGPLRRPLPLRPAVEPGRIEQRNGRIDRKLQPAAEVRCHYFVYPQRAEDRVLEVLVRKTETIKRELGSLSQVIDDDIERRLRRRHPPRRRRAPRRRDRAGRPRPRAQARRRARSSRRRASARTTSRSDRPLPDAARALARVDRASSRISSATRFLRARAARRRAAAERRRRARRRSGAFPALDQRDRGGPELGGDARHAPRAPASRPEARPTGGARRRSGRSSSRTRA